MPEVNLTETISSFRIEKEVKDKLVKRADDEGRTLTNLIQLILRKEAKKNNA